MLAVAIHGRKPDRSFEELSVVSLTRGVEDEGGYLPEGTSGVVVAAYPDGLAYEVEFHEPFHAVVTLDFDALTA